MSVFLQDLRVALKERDTALAEAQRAETARVRSLRDTVTRLRPPVVAMRRMAGALHDQADALSSGAFETLCGMADHLVSLLDALASGTEGATVVPAPKDLPSVGAHELEQLANLHVARHVSNALDNGLCMRLRRRGEPTDHRWPVDLALLGRLLDQLLDNAVRHNDQGEISVVVEFTGNAGSQARLHVIDAGRGAPTSDFAPLLQTTDDAVESGAPRGVGLFRARALADQLGCRLSVRSTLGKGTRITIDLPSHRSLTDAVSEGAAGMLDSGAHLVRLQRNIFSLSREQARSNEQLQHARIDGLTRLIAAAELKDDDTGKHILRMGFFSAVIARSHGRNARYCEMLLHASRMHDVGKIGVPDSVLKKRGSLTSDEWAIMRQHPEIGARLLAGSNDPMYDLAAEIALAHHEKWDGSGYPSQLRGEAIPLGARIVALADFFDAVTMDRCYRPAMTDEQAFELIRQGSGTHFDPVVVEAFFRAVPELITVRERINRGEQVTF